MQMTRGKKALVLVLLALVAMPVQAQVARVLEARGASVVERAGQPPRILGVGEKLDRLDVIRVARDSHAILEFNDRSRVTLRPNTVFRIDAYNEGVPESVLFGLVRGGFRAVTGLLAKRNPGAVRFQTATIDIRGTEFDARLCEDDCAQEERARPGPRPLFEPVARVVEMSGVAFAARAGESARRLVPGAAIYEREGIATGPKSYAVLVFRDDTRVTLEQGSVFEIAAYRYDQDAPRRSAARLRLLNGHAHVATGALAKLRGDAFLFESAMGTIRPQGTGFSVGGCVGSFCGSVTVTADSGGATVTTTTSTDNSSTSTSTGTSDAGNTGAAIGTAISNAAAAVEVGLSTALPAVIDAAVTAIATTATAVEAGLSTALPAVIGAAETATATNDVAARIQTVTGKTRSVIDTGLSVVESAIVNSATAAADAAARNVSPPTAETVQETVQTGAEIGAAIVGTAATVATGGTALGVATPEMVQAVLGGIQTMANEAGRVFTGAGARVGLTAFGETVAANMETNLVQWLTGSLTGAGIPLPQDVSLRSLLQVFLGIGAATKASILKKMEENLGPQAVELVRLIEGLDVTLISEGPAAFWRKVSTNIASAGPTLAGWAQQNIDAVRDAKAQADAAAAQAAADAKARTDAVARQVAADAARLKAEADAKTRQAANEAERILVERLRTSVDEMVRLGQIAASDGEVLVNIESVILRLIVNTLVTQGQITASDLLDEPIVKIETAILRLIVDTLVTQGQTEASDLPDEPVVKIETAILRLIVNTLVTQGQIAASDLLNAPIVKIETAILRLIVGTLITQGQTAASNLINEPMVKVETAIVRLIVNTLVTQGRIIASDGEFYLGEVIPALSMQGDRPSSTATDAGSGSGQSDSGSNTYTGGTSTAPTVQVWDGSVEVARNQRNYIVEKGSGMGLDAGGSVVAAWATMQLVGGAPRPDLVKVDTDLFRGGKNTVDPGLYVWVRDGTIQLARDTQSVDVPAGNAAVATADKIVLLDVVPNFMRFDQTPLPTDGTGSEVADAFRAADGSFGSCKAK